MKRIILFLLLLIVNCQLLIASVRYVSHSGSNTPPYLTWETAADSIMSAINISSFGDTIYVANGVYEEQVVMIPGLSLIGVGMDSCIIDTRNLVNAVDFISVKVSNNCLFRGFNIKVYYNSSRGYGITAGENSLITLNRITTGGIGVYIGSNPQIYMNIFNNVSIGLWLFNSISTIKGNVIYTDPNSTSTNICGMFIQANDYTYKPIIDSNLIYAQRIHQYSPPTYGINKSYGAKPFIKDNIILTGPYFVYGIFLSYSDSINIVNNLLWGAGYGIDNEGVQYLRVHNNYIGGDINKGIIAGPYDTLKNNIIANADIAIEKWNNYGPPQVKYNNFWNNTVNCSGFSADTTNIYEYPMVINEDTSWGDLNLHLQMFSPLIDRGDPSILDKDGTNSDIGLYGGPYGESYKYIDLPPRTPVNFIAILDSNYILLKWNRNTEADFSNYMIYRDTMQGFPIDSTTLVALIKDTFYIQMIPPDITDFYFRVTAVDNQGNESEPSEEKHIVLSGTMNNETSTINNYQLYQNYPNPFNPSTKIGYWLKERGYVKLYVYDVKGELIETLVNQYQDDGYYEVEFSGRNLINQIPTGLASGIYIYQIMVKNEKNIPVFSDIRKMVLVK